MDYFDDDSDDNITEKAKIKPRRPAPVRTKERSALEARYQMPADDGEEDRDHKPLISQHATHTHEDGGSRETDEGDSESDEEGLPTVQAELDMTAEEEGETATEEEGEEESEESGEEESPGQRGDLQLDAMEEGDDQDEDIDEPLELYMYQDDPATFEPDDNAILF